MTEIEYEAVFEVKMPTPKCVERSEGSEATMLMEAKAREYVDFVLEYVDDDARASLAVKVKEIVGSCTMEWSVTGKQDSIKAIREGLAREGYQFEIKRFRPREKGSILTTTQAEVVRAAFEMGYFDFPKRIGIRELAKKFDISISTLSEILRSGQRKIMGSFFEAVGAVA